MRKNVLFFLTPKAMCQFLYDDFTVRQALEKMESSGYTALPIVNKRGESRGTLSEGDVLWAMNTRFQGNEDVVAIPGVRCHQLDPSNDPTMSPSIRSRGIACKTIFDCTVPFAEKERFQRSRFMDADPSQWFPELF